MKTLINWIVEQVTTQWIAIITAIAGVIAWSRSHAKLIAEIDQQAQPVSAILLNDGRSIANFEHGMQHLVLWLINPSDHDISYFDMRATLDANELDLYSAAKFNHYNGLENTSAEAIIATSNGGKDAVTLSVHIPQANYGTVPSHGFVQLDLIFETAVASDNGMFLMKLAEQHSLWSRLRHARRVPKWLRPKLGYIHSETKAVAQSFRVTEVIAPKRPEQQGPDTH